MRRILSVIPVAVIAADTLAEPRVLFVRGADRSGGAHEASNDFERTEHLADIDNQSTEPGNHGWFELAQLLRDDGFVVEQIAESVEPGAPPTGHVQGRHIDLELIDLAAYDVVVLGSNNAVYDAPAVDALEAYILGGGAALFVSDLGFGSGWPDAASSDQQFLDRFGWTMQQDFGFYDVTRADGDFVSPDHPVLIGVDVIGGEGESPLVRPAIDPPGVRTTILARAKPGERTRNNDGDPGSFRDVTAADAAVMVATAGCGRLAGHFDRNTFFNDRGAGTNLNRNDHRAYALNLFRWLAEAGAGPADIAEPFGRLDYADVVAFLGAFNVQDPLADIAAPFGVWDYVDVLEFLNAFGRGCEAPPTPSVPPGVSPGGGSL